MPHKGTTKKDAQALMSMLMYAIEEARRMPENVKIVPPLEDAYEALCKAHSQLPDKNETTPQH